MTRIDPFRWVFFWCLSTSVLSNMMKTCHFYLESNGAFYNFAPLIRNNSDYSYYTKEQDLIEFNFCKPTKDSCYMPTSSYAIIKNSAKQLCKPIAPISPDFEVAPLNDTDPDQGVIISYAQGPINPFNGIPYKFQLQIRCSSDRLFIESIETAGSTITLNAFSQFACPIITTSDTFFFMQSHSGLFAVIFIIIGLYFLFLGYRFYRITTFALGLSLWVYLIPLTIQANHSMISTSVLIILDVFVCLIGVLFGYLCRKYKGLGAFVVGSVGGYICSLIVYDTVLIFLNLGLYYLIYTEVGMIVLCGVLFHGFYQSDKYKLAIEVLTSFIGSYIAMRGYCLGWKGFLSEMMTAEAISKGVFDGIDPLYPFILGMLWALGVIGFAVQYQINKQRGVRAVGATDREERAILKERKDRRAIMLHARESDLDDQSPLSNLSSYLL